MLYTIISISAIIILSPIVLLFVIRGVMYETLGRPKKNKPVVKMSEIDLESKVQWKIVRNGKKGMDMRYYVMFYNPLFKEYWYLPNSLSDFIKHTKWSLRNKGFYGNYNEGVFTDLDKNNITEYLENIETIQDLSNYLNNLGKLYVFFNS